jgi:hypothetical protein
MEPIGVISFLKVAERPRFAMIVSQGVRPKTRLDLGPLDMTHSFGFEVPDPLQAKRVAKACRNLVKPLTQLNGAVTWIDERAILAIRLFLRSSYGHALGVRPLGRRRFLGMFARLGGSNVARRTCDAFLRDCDRKGRQQARASAKRKCALYIVREDDSLRCRFKVGISCRPEARAKALRALHPRVVRSFATKELARAVEQGVHALLHPFRERRPRQCGIRAGDTEWFRPAAANLVHRTALYFSKHVAACAALRARRRAD